MTTKFRSMQQVLWIVLVISYGTLALPGCSSVHVAAKQASKADDTFETTVWALWWGGSDPVESVDCSGNGLQVVSTSTNWLYSLCAVVTLGAVVPLDIEYRCTSTPLQGGDELGAVPGDNQSGDHQSGDQQ